MRDRETAVFYGGFYSLLGFLYGCVGEILTEKSGHLNLGVEGMMFMGGVAGLAGTFYYEKACGGEKDRS